MDNDYKAKKLIDGKGVLFTNLNKIDDYSPDMKGELLYKGELIRLGGWIRETKMGRLISIGVDKVKGDDYGNS